MRALAFAVALLVVAGLAAACSNSKASEPEVVLRVRTPAQGNTTIDVENTPTPLPQPELVLSTLEVHQGGTLLASVTGGIAGGTATFLGRTSDLIQGERSMYSFLGVGVLDPPGPHQLKVDFELGNGSTGSLNATISVLETAWTVDAIEFTPEQTEDLLDPSAVQQEQQRLAQIYATETEDKLWEGPWLLPVDGALTARFGEQRAVNGGEPSGHHGGTDIGAEEGTPVVASNRGRVVFAGQLHLRGNMVILDHGGGLLSGYAHLSAINVQEGQMVPAGGLIGEVGNTGLSTGAHLHWEMSADGILVDALRFTDGTNGF